MFTNQKLAVAGNTRAGSGRNELLIYGSVALGVLAGAAVSTYVWRQRVKAALDSHPLEKADKMIDAVEKKLENIEKMMRDLQTKADDTSDY